MDNDNRIVHLTKEIIKTIFFKFSYMGKTVLEEEEGNSLIYDCISQNMPFAVGRFGAVEARCVSKYISSALYSEYNIVSIKEAAGFFPNTPDNIDRFAQLYLSAAKELDVLAVWGVERERYLVDKYCPNAVLTKILALEPYFYDKPWSKALRNKRVLVIHPFIETIKHQLVENRERIFSNPEVLPEFRSISYIKAVQSNADAKTDFKSWFDALNYMCADIDKTEFDIAIIGAGAYGLPLAAHCKKIGKQAVQMGGATQILFGVKGKRWETRQEYIKLMNDYWVKPSQNETPDGIEKVEGGSYW